VVVVDVDVLLDVDVLVVVVLVDELVLEVVVVELLVLVVDVDVEVDVVGALPEPSNSTTTTDSGRACEPVSSFEKVITVPELIGSAVFVAFRSMLHWTSDRMPFLRSPVVARVRFVPSGDAACLVLMLRVK